MSRASLISVLALAASVAACAPTLGPPPPGGSAPPPISSTATFSASDFAWSQKSGRNVIAGRVAYRLGGARYSCAGASVVLTPETAWSRRRMAVLYGTGERAALPTDDVRARTATAPPGDAGPYVKRTTCDEGDQFAFGGLPDGAWYVITVARPANNPKGESMALMRRVVVRGGRTANVTL
jgi:hypothetical protein